MSDLSPAVRNFILHWGEMGTRWGINRTVAQIHALLFVSPEPLHAEDIATTLQVSRSNVSTSLRELLSWGLIRTTQKLGDRRDYYEALGDVWEMARRVAEERKRRELDPTLAALRDCVGGLDGSSKTQEHQRRRLTELLGFVETFAEFYEQLRPIPTPLLRRFFKLGNKLPRLLGAKD